MKLYLKTYLNCSAELAWREVQTPNLLIKIARPIVTFKPDSPPKFPAIWPSGGNLQLKSYLFGLIPLGLRTLYFERVDAERMQLQTREHDVLVKKWDHLISIEPMTDEKALYSDYIEIEAGVFTILVWAFAQVFYRHRQRRWRKLAMSLRL